MSKTYRRQSSDKFERSQRKSHDRIPRKGNIDYIANITADDDEIYDDDLEDLEYGYINRVYVNK